MMSCTTFTRGDLVRSRGRVGVVVAVVDSTSEGDARWELHVDTAIKRWGGWRAEGICIWEPGSTVIADDDQAVMLVTRLGLRDLDST
jgi:hypothetical protein